jgi:hypothetical protein
VREGGYKMYRYVVTFEDGRHIAGIIPSLTYLEAELWELEWAARKKRSARIVNVDCWGDRNESKYYGQWQSKATIQRACQKRASQEL